MCHEGLAAHEHKVCNVPLQQLRVARHILQHLAAALQMGLCLRKCIQCVSASENHTAGSCYDLRCKQLLDWSLQDQ